MQEAVVNNHMNNQGRSMSNSIAVLVLLVSLSMLFATLMLGYIFFRLTADVWPPMGMPKADLFYPTLSTFIIALSSFSYHIFESSYKSGKENFKQWSIYLTVFLSLAFLGSQFQLWSQLNQIGLYVEGGIFPSILHGFTWIHAGHLVLAIFLLFYLLYVSSTEPFKKDRTSAIENIGKIWHFLGIVWLIMYLTIFVI